MECGKSYGAPLLGKRLKRLRKATLYVFAKVNILESSRVRYLIKLGGTKINEILKTT